MENDEWADIKCDQTSSVENGWTHILFQDPVLRGERSQQGVPNATISDKMVESIHRL